MTTSISTILRRAIGIDRPNILTSITHAGYESNLARSNAEFYSLSNVGGEDKKWDEHNRPCPKNYHVLNKINEIPSWLDVDILLSQHKWGSFQTMSNIAKQLGIPHINLEHTLPTTGLTKEDIEGYRQLNADINVFISEFSRDAWGYTPENSVVIKHGIDTDIFTPGNLIRQPRILSVVNRWIERNWCTGFDIWKRVTKDLPVFPVGDTPGLSESAKDVVELVGYYQSSQIFINTSIVSPIPMSLLESMACGCAVVSTATCMIPEIIIDGYNGFITNDEEQMRNKIVMLLNNPTLAAQLGNNARKTIESEFSLERFTNDWNQLFERVL